MRAGWGIGVGALVAVFGARLTSACSLDLDTGLIHGNDASGEPGGGAGGTLSGDAPWQGGSDGKAGADGSDTGAAGGADGAVDASDGEVGCSPVKEICDNGVDDDCDKDIDCADGDCAFQKCGTDSECKAGACTSVYVSATVGCGNSGQTGNDLCLAAGWAGCNDSIGYWWFQCAGPGECPGGWSGLTCSTYAGAPDCAGAAIGGSDYNTSANGCTTPYGALDFGYDCSSYNPGYTVRLSCR